jgi:uncharacterized protein YkwD
MNLKVIEHNRRTKIKQKHGIMKFKLDWKFFTKLVITGLLTMSLIFSYNSFLNAVPRSAQANVFLEDQLFIEVNNIRKENNLPELNKNLELQKAAKLKTIDMINNKYFAHISPSNYKWSDFIKEQGYNYIYAGENLAKDYENSREIISAWIESPSHRENILNPDYVDTGIAVSFNRSNLSSGILVAQEFGKKI